ncbi:MAG: hypothetical protein QOK37_3173 [Thermoanaerobaculia bacterium]|jgi:hypothetical protein|nr:hypothetical protein [Thermoanaerobaculia bacterium]
MLHGRRIVNELLKAEVDRHDNLSGFFDYCRFAFNEQDDTAIQYFVSSFSELDDDHELWRRYGRGKSVVMRFATHRMGADPAEPFTYYMARVTYSPREQSQLLSPLIYGARMVVASYVREYGYDLRDDLAIQAAAAKLCSHLNHHSISLKDETWSVEHEWRAVFSLLGNDPAERKNRVKLRDDGRPYVDVSIRSVEPDDVHMPLLSVTLSACTAKDDIRDKLSEYGYQNVEVKQTLTLAE